ncbi:MAG: ribonuclease HII [Ruminococcus sp.]|nr:ribonuclease HII [Ruminococcus sp.]
MTLYEFDCEFRKDYKVICGCDEAGRGPLAGDVFAAAVVFDEDTVIEGINDSKKLTAKKREELYDIIIKKAKAYAICSASVEEIEKLNILESSKLAMKRAVEKLGIRPELCLIDGNRPPVIEGSEVIAVVKGDGKSQSVAAASVLAKVARDRYMEDMAKKYPQYQFEKHKGYGTKLHYEMIDKYGPCELHRPLFLRKYYEKRAEQQADR